MDSQDMNLIQELSKLCGNVFEELVSSPPEGVGTDDSIATLAREERGRFKLWGDGFSVLEGDLDRLLLRNAADRNLWDSVVILLCGQARALVSILRIRQGEPTEPTPHQAKHTSKTFTISQASRTPHTKYILQKWTNLTRLLIAAGKFVPDYSFADGYFFRGEIYSELLNDDYDFDDIKDYNDSLFDIAMYIEPLWSTVSEGVQEEAQEISLDIEPSTEDEMENLEDYENLVRFLFPEIDNLFLNTLVEVYRLRVRRLRKTGHYGTPMRASETGASNESRLIVSFPPEVTYHCDTCSQDFDGIDDRKQWEEHILHDIQPYSCLDNFCAERTMTFSNSTDWIEHESKHRLTSEWVCIENCGETFHNKQDFLDHVLGVHLAGCAKQIGNTLDTLADSRKLIVSPSYPLAIVCPFCKGGIGETAHALESHVGEHMRKLALETFALLQGMSCLFAFGGCGVRLDSDTWGAHVKKHIQGVIPPISYNCSICSESIESKTPKIAWEIFLDHTLEHKYLGILIPDQEFIKFCLVNRLIHISSVEMFLDVTREGEERRGRLLGNIKNDVLIGSRVLGAFYLDTVPRKPPEASVKSSYPEAKDNLGLQNLSQSTPVQSAILVQEIESFLHYKLVIGSICDGTVSFIMFIDKVSSTCWDAITEFNRCAGNLDYYRTAKFFFIDVGNPQLDLVTEELGILSVPVIVAFKAEKHSVTSIPQLSNVQSFIEEHC